MVVRFAMKVKLQDPRYCGKPSHDSEITCVPNSGVSYFISYVAPCHGR
jgi:hypothetical protein